MPPLFFRGNFLRRLNSLLLLISVCYISVIGSTSVTIPNIGRVKGHAHPDDASIVSFLGIRYAQGPVGPLRWTAPQKTGWETEFDATETVACAQSASVILKPGLNVTEDCLRMNIWVKNTTLYSATTQNPKLYAACLSFDSFSSTLRQLKRIHIHKSLHLFVSNIFFEDSQLIPNDSLDQFSD